MLFDPAILIDLQAAIVPPTAPPAIERAWISPNNEEGRRVIMSAMEQEQAQGELWRANLAIWTNTFGRVRGVPRSVSELAILDRLVRFTSRQTRTLEREARITRRRLIKVQKLVEAEDLMSGRLFGEYMRHMDEMRSENISALGVLAAAIRKYRDDVDYRGRAAFNDVQRKFLPNQESVAAMEEARGGMDMRTTPSLSDLMAELRAEVD